MRIGGTLFACFPPRPWCRTKTVARSRVCCVRPSWSARTNQTTARDMCTPDPSRLRRLRRAASSWQPAQHHSGTAAAGCPLPVSMQQTQPALLQPQETCLPACWSRFAHALRRLRCMSTQAASVCCDEWVHTHRACKHVLRIGRTSRPAYEDCTRNVFTVLQSRSSGPHRSALLSVGCHVWRCIAEILMTAPHFLDGIVFKRYFRCQFSLFFSEGGSL